MKKIVTIGIIGILIISSSVISISAKIESKSKGTIELDQEFNTIKIRVGIVKSALLTMNCSVGKSCFVAELDNYSWTVGGQEYIIQLNQISRNPNNILYFSDLLNYKKIKENYDVLIVSGIQDELILGGLPFTRNEIGVTPL